ncbi:MAG: hypothetical protein QOG20_259 [Pseudonocardiales bacterium]|jgi:hypothetical protein|nr:hypothetical protein [Pseudonocardiales bacterium]
MKPPKVFGRGRNPFRRNLFRVGVLTAALTAVTGVLAVAAEAAPSAPYVAGVTFPFNGVWLESTDGGHYWDSSGNGLCRIDAAAGGGFTENVGTCDVQAKKPTQATVGPVNGDGTYFVYAADMSSKSGGPVRVTYDPNANGGAGGIIAGSGTTLGGLNTVGFFADAAGNFKNSSVALGPCDATIATPCRALYLGFERSQKIERINFVDQPVAAQSIETISKTTDKRKGVRFGIGDFHKPATATAPATDDLYIDELGGNGVSLLTDIAHCAPSEGAADPTVVNPPVNQAGGCAASVVGGITTNFPQGMAVQNDANGNSQFLYVADSPRNSGATVLRYHPDTGLQDVVSNAITPPVPDLLNGAPALQSNYTFVMGLAVDPHNGDLFIGDDPTFAVLVNPPLNKGHIFTIPGVNGVAPADCLGSAATPCTPPPPPSVSTPSLYAYGLTAPKGGATFVPSDDGGHIWVADHSQGLCRMDQVTDPKLGVLNLHAFNSAACDDGTVLGSGGQTVHDDVVVAGTPNHHFLYVAQNDHLSPGVIRFEYDPSADNGAGNLVPGSAVVMAPGAGLNGDKANGLAMGCNKPVAFGQTCAGQGGGNVLYMGGLLDGFIRRVNNPEADPRVQTVDVVAMTTEQKAGTLGKGINGSMGMIGDDLYLPENQGFTVVKNISTCPAGNQVCATVPLNISQFGFVFGSAIGVDTNPQHSTSGLVYAAISPGAANATVYQYDVATNTSRIFATQGQLPTAGSSEATVWCTTTCTRPADPANPPGAKAAFRFAQGIMVDPRSDELGGGTVYLTEDAFAGARGGRGHAWSTPFTPYPAGATPVALPVTTPVAGSQTCNLTVNIPSLAGGQTYWVQFTTRATGQISSTWTIPVSQAAQLVLYQGNPFTGLADPVATGTKGGSIAIQNTTAGRFSISTAPNTQPAGTYTVQFFNSSKAFAATTGTLSFLNDGPTACVPSPVTGHVIN